MSITKTTPTTATDDDFNPATEKQCECDHKLQGTGAVFFQSIGWLYCVNCRGWQRIRKPVS